MAFGFPAHHELDVAIPVALYDDWIAAVCARLGWSVPGRVAGGPLGFQWAATSAMSLWSWGEQVRIVPVGPNALRVESKCQMPTQCFDWGRNQKNCNEFARVLGEMLAAARPR